MAIYRNRLTTEYVQVRNNLARDPTLSFKAKGILIYLLSLPPTWEANETDIANHSTDGRHAVRSGLLELEQQGFILRSQMRNADGTFSGYQFDVFDARQPDDLRTSPEERKKEPAVIRKPDYGEPDFGEPDTINTEDSNTDGKKTEKDVFSHSGEDHEEANAADRWFGEKPPSSPEKRIDWADPEVREERLRRSSQSYLRRARQDEPWHMWNPDRIRDREGISAHNLQHVGWLMEDITGYAPLSDGAWITWRKAYVEIYQEAEGNFDLIEEAIRNKWEVDDKYRTTKPESIRLEVGKLRAEKTEHRRQEPIRLGGSEWYT